MDFILILVYCKNTDPLIKTKPKNEVLMAKKLPAKNNKNIEQKISTIS